MSNKVNPSDKEILRLTYIVDGKELSVEFTADNIILDDFTWNWLRGAFAGIGFSAKDVEDYFNE